MKTETSKANNLTDKEIKKALECCCNSQGCSKCDFSPKCDGFTSVKLALDLINRLEIEIEELKCKNSNLTSYLTSLQKDLTSAKAEVERLEKALENQQKISMDRHFEIERLKNHIQEGIDLAKQIPEMLALAKAGVLKEAAKKFAGHSDYHGDTILCTLICMAEGKEVGNAKPLK